MKIENVALAVTALTAALVLAGCGSTGTADPAVPAPSAARSAHNAVDVAFAQDMIPHHAQAVEMSGPAATRAVSGEVREIAAGIGRAQEPEIGQLRALLAAWGAPEAPAGGMAGMSGTEGMTDGMMDDGQMDRLASASGPAFDRMFLQMMLAHHEGAVRMAGTELTSGADPQARALAQRIVDTQRSEIDRMRRLLG